MDVHYLFYAKKTLVNPTDSTYAKSTPDYYYSYYYYYYFYYHDYYDYTVISMISFKMVPYPLCSHHRPFIQFQIFKMLRVIWTISSKY